MDSGGLAPHSAAGPEEGTDFPPTWERQDNVAHLEVTDRLLKDVVVSLCLRNKDSSGYLKKPLSKVSPVSTVGLGWGCSSQEDTR